HLPLPSPLPHLLSARTASPHPLSWIVARSVLRLNDVSGRPFCQDWSRDSGTTRRQRWRASDESGGERDWTVWQRRPSFAYPRSMEDEGAGSRERRGAVYAAARGSCSNGGDSFKRSLPESSGNATNRPGHADDIRDAELHDLRAECAGQREGRGPPAWPF